MQSSNEEFQSTNEELESSREELQSLNEELYTINAELQSKVEELSAVHDDMHNLLNSTEIATIFVDNDMRVRRFTPGATTIVNLIPSDMGRPLQHVVANLSYEGLISDLGDVLKQLTPKEVEVQTTAGAWYKMRIIPYRTMDNRIDGAVLTFTAIDEQKRAQQVLRSANLEMKRAGLLIRKIFDMDPDPLVVLGQEGKMVAANSAFSNLMKIDPENVQDTDIFTINSGLLKRADLATELAAALEKGENFQIRPGKSAPSEKIGSLPDDGPGYSGGRRFAVPVSSAVREEMMQGMTKMTPRQDQADPFDRLRRQAEALIDQRSDSDVEAPSDILELIHELKIHQAELEIQNEELKRAQLELTDLYRQFEDLYEFAPCGYLNLDPKGLITRINLAGVMLLNGLRENILHTGFRRLISPGWQDAYLDALKAAGRTGDRQSLELQLNRAKGADDLGAGGYPGGPG